MVQESARPGRLQGRTALVTGSAGGIGSKIVERFGAEGASVACLDVVPSEVAQSQGGVGVIESFVCDLRDSEDLRETLTSVRERLGEVDLLVNNAGIMRRGALTQLESEDWTATFDVNVNAMFELTHLILPRMIEAGRGVVLNMASQWGLMPAQGHIAYSSSKAAVVAFTKSLARDHGAQGIRANAICPGEILTPMVESKMSDHGLSEADLAGDIPLGRLGRPDDVAACAAFLASDEAAFVSGAVLEVTGGQTVT